MFLLKEIFIEEPRWGLRGDPEMWEQLSVFFRNINESSLNTESFSLLLEKKFHEFIEFNGEKVSEDIVWFKSFSQKGMSGGSISLIWWKEKGLPILKKRFTELKE